MIEVSAPGKLYIAGEYAVVETGHPAVIAPISCGKQGCVIRRSLSVLIHACILRSMYP